MDYSDIFLKYLKDHTSVVVFGVACVVVALISGRTGDAEWARKNPELNLVLECLRAVALDFQKLYRALKAYAKVRGIRWPNFLPLVLLGFALPMLNGCAGTLEETKAQVQLNSLVGVKVTPPDASICRDISSKERIWTGVATAGAILAGTAGLALIPVDKPWQKQALAGGIVTAGLGAGVGLVEQQSYAREWQRERCDK